ncbi:hypothetical protein BpHYR1_015048 [Brachionus plicatilis]|uniref:Uncharacterized protein n=1 Tax=Brachionus plicatilis TaxID=10195 RepID=A0A3M7PJH1_BRAPC|nr:hypothetical protein BpHYR1_015048 [Brachionus plicatilis]
MVNKSFVILFDPIRQIAKLAKYHLSAFLAVPNIRTEGKTASRPYNKKKGVSLLVILMVTL